MNTTRSMCLLGLVSFLGACGDDIPAITVTCAKAPAAEGVVIECQGDDNITIGGDAQDPAPEPAASYPPCSDSTDCAKGPMICEAHTHCISGHCYCNNQILVNPECKTIVDCPPPAEIFPNCSRRNCWEGVCGYAPYTSDGPPCYDND